MLFFRIDLPPLADCSAPAAASLSTSEGSPAEESEREQAEQHLEAYIRDRGTGNVPFPAQALRPSVDELPRASDVETIGTLHARVSRRAPWTYIDEFTPTQEVNRTLSALLLACFSSARPSETGDDPLRIRNGAQTVQALRGQTFVVTQPDEAPTAVFDNLFASILSVSEKVEQHSKTLPAMPMASCTNALREFHTALRRMSCGFLHQAYSMSAAGSAVIGPITSIERLMRQSRLPRCDQTPPP